MRIGVDTGGTFTDFVFLRPDGSLAVRKVPSTPADPSKAIVAGLGEAGDEGMCALVHGTTVATNALLERRGPTTALLTTEGCRDVLEIARQTRDELYSLSPAPRVPLIPRELRFEVPERLDWQGRVVTPLDVDAVERALDGMVARGVESLAICFLFAFLDPAHEREAGRRARARGLAVSLSSDIAPEYREYERTSTVCANAFVAPVMARYLRRLEARLDERRTTNDEQGGFVVGRSSFVSPNGRLSIMQSNGGTLRAEEAAVSAVKTVLSGPAGGLVAAARVARDAGIGRILTFDMGGTSTDVALVDGEPRTMRTGEVAGLPLLTPMLDIHTVGAGGGSIARLDAGGGLRVGPESAGADPGPVAYGRGERLTVTDANVLLGLLPATARLAGSMALDVERVRAHFTALAARMGMSPERAAEGVREVVNAQMARALRHISTERGHDPADYTLVSLGGAGGLHACALAEALAMPRILVPRYPGAFSALGLALADVRRELARSFFAPATDAHDAAVGEAMRGLAKQAASEMQAEGVAAGEVALEPFVEARYVGQSYALRVPFRRRLAVAAREFHRAHRARYGHADAGQPVEIVLVGLAASGRSGGPVALRVELPDAQGAPVGAARAWHDGREVEAALYRRDALGAGQCVAGPALVLQDDATTWVAPGWSAEVDGMANLLLRRESS